MDSREHQSSISNELVLRIFNKLFGSDPNVDELLALLQTYIGAELERVHLAILKLSDGNPEKLRHNVEATKIDCRDVLAWAEYPEQMESGASIFNSSIDIIEGVRKRDKDQYQTWLAQ